MFKGFHELLVGFDSKYPAYNGAGYEVAGMVWLQGWNDDNANGAPEYEQNLTALVADVRRDLGIADLPVIISDAPRNPAVQFHEDVAAARQNVVNALNTQMPGSAVYVDSLGVGNPSEGGFYHWNFTASNYIEMGKRNAAGAQSVMRGGSVNHEGNSDIAEAWNGFRDTYSRTALYNVEEAGGTAVVNTAGGGSVLDATLSSVTARVGVGLAPGSTSSLDANLGVIRATHDLERSGAFTLGAWVQLNDTLADNNATYVLMSSEDSASTGTNSGWDFGVQRKQINGEWQNVLYFDANKFAHATSVNDSLGRDDIVLEEGKTYFAAFVRDHALTTPGEPESPENTVFFLYDAEAGILHINDAGKGSRQATITFENTRIGIGMSSDNLNEDLATQFAGLIDEAQIWNVGLTEADILTLVQQGQLSTPIPEPGSLGLLGVGGLVLMRRRR